MDGAVAGFAKMYASEVALTCALESMRIHDVQRLVIARSLISGTGRLGWQATT
jgi:alkylation response protein AidB-like acyl-CoA dehydrogenase